MKVRRSFPLFLALALAALPALAQRPAARQGIDPKVRDILEETMEYLRQAKQMTFEAEIHYDEVLPTGNILQYGAVNHVALRRPNRLRADYDGDQRRTRAFYDGKTITLYHADENFYASAPMPATVDAMLDTLAEKYGFSVPLSDLLYDRPILMEEVNRAFYVGRHKVHGIPCHHIAAFQDVVDWQVWIEDGEQLVPRKIVITYKHEPGSPQYMAVFTNWNLNPRLPDRLFEFEPPEDAERIPLRPLKRSQPSP